MAGKCVPLEKRFWKKVDRTHGLGPDGDCWEWRAKTAGVKGFQYGMIHLGGSPTKLVQATHVAWFLTTGEWPQEFMLHRCDNPLCVRFSHLFEGTHQDNADDRERKGKHTGGRMHWGESVNTAKLTVEGVLVIRRLYGWGLASQTELAKRYGVTQVQISNVINRRSWAWLDDEEG